MDVLRATIWIAQAKVEREIVRRLAFAIIERRIVRKRLARREKEEAKMAGEIRAKMAELRAARTKLVSDLTTEIDGVITDIGTVRADGLEATKLPRAELDSIRQEVREIHAEFAPSTNGPPPGPLPDTPPVSPPPSPAPQAAEPSASWASGNK